eukprot:2789848-Rhodomonas_salina.3
MRTALALTKGSCTAGRLVRGLLNDGSAASQDGPSKCKGASLDPPLKKLCAGSTPSHPLESRTSFFSSDVDRSHRRTEPSSPPEAIMWPRGLKARVLIADVCPLSGSQIWCPEAASQTLHTATAKACGGVTETEASNVCVVAQV